uniref:TAF4B RNA polymerase II, TATA box binding protein (TBP)-associated factor n=1 Tax=Sinocyclocheilus grahami TaxID=75366 RepID=A0A672PN75_SINGR
LETLLTIFKLFLHLLYENGTRSANMAQNIRALVKGLLLKKLYMELKSPQPYLVPFLKRSLPAVRQLTPNSQLFIQQCDQLKSSDSASTKAANQKSTASASSSLKPNQPTRTAQLVNPAHFYIPQAQAEDDDDINDVASMAGVNLSVENARILASGSELVGSVIRSCQEEPFLFPSALQSRLLQIGGSLSITEVYPPDVLELLSLVTQERLRDLLEKITIVAQHPQISYKVNLPKKKHSRQIHLYLYFIIFIYACNLFIFYADDFLFHIVIYSRKTKYPLLSNMQQLELAQMEHRDANLAALAASGPRKRKPLEAPGSGANQVPAHVHTVASAVSYPVYERELVYCDSFHD